MNKGFEKQTSEIWKKIVDIHSITKELYIRSEEYNEELSSFIQPIKELKDAYEHIVRSQANVYSDNVSERYVLENLNKAVGHEYRAFFDTADFMGIILRSKIMNRLKGFEYKQIIDVYPEYQTVRVRIMDITEQIAELRVKKDVGSADKMYQLIIEYQSAIYELLDYYKIIEKEVYPKLEMKYH